MRVSPPRSRRPRRGAGRLAVMPATARTGLFASLVLLAACARSAVTVGPFSDGLVRPGLDVFLTDVPTALRGKRIGLIANHSAIDRAGRPAIDLLAKHNDLALVALFAPEH